MVGPISGSMSCRAMKQVTRLAIPPTCTTIAPRTHGPTQAMLQGHDFCAVRGKRQEARGENEYMHKRTAEKPAPGRSVHMWSHVHIRLRLGGGAPLALCRSAEPADSHRPLRPAQRARKAGLHPGGMHETITQCVAGCWRMVRGGGL